MQNIISDLIALKSLAKEVHWNGRGRGFLYIHAFLDDIYAICDKYIDEVAEHMVATGFYGDPLWVATEHDNFESEDVTDGLSYVRNLLGKATVDANHAIEEITHDPAGEDILVRILQDMNKYWWFADAEVND